MVLGTLTVHQLGYFIWSKRLVRGMVPAAERMRLTECLSLISQVTPRWLLRGLVWGQIGAAICAGIAFVMTFVIFAMTRSPTAVAMVATICMLSVALLVSAALLHAILRFSRRSP